MSELSKDSQYKWRYGFFLGCVIPNRYPMIERSIRDVFDELGAELLDLPGASCCPAPGVFRAFHIPTWLVLAARNIVIGEELGVSTITGCNGCYGTLRDAWYDLEHNPEEKKKVNEYLAKVGRKYTGKYEPKHIVQGLYLDMGLDYVKDFIKYKFTDLKVGVHYGCHIVKPSDKRPWHGQYENPQFLDELVEITGAKSIPYKDKFMCCGAGGAVRTAVKEVAADFTREKLVNMRDAGVDIIINCCPFCHLQLDLGQVEVNNFYKDIIGEPFKIPVIYITQLLGVAMGMDPNRLGLVKNHELSGVSPFIPIEPFLDIVKEQI
ncbi:MAG: CoB--CoM heterodisulfide reductase subunit B [Promethearchaeota archaeon]|nr:MAG: CoB--CoM heterodisulfide reductase subunit B [Candidatus Lokiarchaeota archaeon]